MTIIYEYAILSVESQAVGAANIIYLLVNYNTGQLDLVGGGYMWSKTYYVKMRMKVNGSVVEFTEVVTYKSCDGPGGSYPEWMREQKAIDQIKERCPEAREVRALSSICP